MYREIAECEEKPEVQKFQWPTIERVNQFMVGTSGLSFIISATLFVIGFILHGFLVGNNSVTHTDPLAVQVFLYGGLAFGAIFGITLLYAAFLSCRYFVRIATGEERI